MSINSDQSASAFSSAECSSLELHQPPGRGRDRVIPHRFVQTPLQAVIHSRININLMMIMIHTHENKLVMMIGIIVLMAMPFSLTMAMAMMAIIMLSTMTMNKLI